MAYRRFPLPTLKLTQRPAFGQKSEKLIQRGVSDSQPVSTYNEPKECPQSPDGSSSRITSPFAMLQPIIELEEPTDYELESKASVAGWGRVRNGMLRAVTEAACLPLAQSCISCEKAASLRCQQCGPLAYFCPDCFDQCHHKVNMFHVAEKWEDGHYIPLQCDDRHLDIRPGHQCTDKSEVLLLCIDEYGIEHKLHFTRCKCEPLAVTITRAQLWPATPTNPSYAFTFSLLDWAEALMLESQVALKDFCNTVKFKCPFHNLKRRGFYSSLINAFEEYRYLKHQLRHLNHLSKNIDAGNVCPACPQGKGKMVYAMDALFGLPRKKSAGTSYQDPLHGNLFFCNQSAVDQFVTDGQQTKATSNDCSNFLAGNVLRSACRYKALDETAVFGYSCRHEFPGKFLNLKHGERLAYGVWMLQEIIEKYSAHGSEIFVMYDIACTLFSHLQSLGRSDILDNVHLCLPTFHSYGHKASCQILFGPRRCEGIGLSDGETMERLWSYLRRFSRMTKEMRPSHRIDVLSSALVYYGMQTKEKLGSLLIARWERSMKTKTVAEESLYQLMPNFSDDTQSKVNQWLRDEADCCRTSKPTAKSIQWHVAYFQTLQTYYSLRNQLASGCSDKGDYGNLAWLDKKLLDFEAKYSIPNRWLPSDTQYKECEYAVLLNKKEQLLLYIWKASQRRMFLINLKRKYADGQKIAKKLSLQISKETKCTKSLLQEYNACESFGEASVDRIDLPEALDPSNIGERLQKFGVWCTVLASGRRREIIDAYLALCRSKEDIRMLTEEAENVVAYYEEKRKIIMKEMEHISVNTDLFSRGAVAMLHLLLAKNTKLLEQSYRTLSVMKNETDVPQSKTAEDDSDNDCSSDDYYSDEDCM